MNVCVVRHAGAVQSSDRKCRFGVLGTANIARKIANAISRSKNASLHAIASRSLDKARAWGAEFSVPVAFGSYEELLACPEVDAVYIPLPTSMHLEWSVKAANAGKHVLCEKPVCGNAADMRAIVDACKANKVG